MDSNRKYQSKSEIEQYSNLSEDKTFIETTIGYKDNEKSSLEKQRTLIFPNYHLNQRSGGNYKQKTKLENFINHGPFTLKNIKIDKMEAFNLTFSKDLDIIYDESASKIEKIKGILLSPQLNFVIIILIILDWIIAVLELLTDLFKDKPQFLNYFEEFAKYFSIGMLSLFIFEIILKILLLPGIFFRSKLELFDAFIVVTSFILEIVLVIKRYDFSGVVSVLTIFRYSLFNLFSILNKK